MEQFSYRVTDPAGIHARPAGLIVKEAAKFKSDIKIKANGKEADAKKIFCSYVPWYQKRRRDDNYSRGQ